MDMLYTQRVFLSNPKILSLPVAYSLFICGRGYLKREYFGIILAVVFVTFSSNAIAFSEVKRNELLQVIYAGDTEQALTLIDKIPQNKINYPFSNKGGTFLHSLVQTRHRNQYEFMPSVIERLVARGLDVNRRDDKGRTAIFYLRGNKNAVEFLKLLVKHGADMTYRDISGQTILHVYAGNGDKDIVQLLLKSGANKNVQDNTGVTPLMVAAKRSRQDIIEVFLSARADINIKDKQDNTIIHYSARSGNFQIVDYLLDLNFPINQRNNLGETALSIFASAQKWSVVRLLLERGADANVPMRNKGSVGLYLLLNPNLGLSGFVSKENIDVNVPTRSGLPYIFHAISKVDLNAVKNLISLGVDVNKTGAPNNPAIPLIAERDPNKYQDSLEVLRLLVDNGANINAQKMGKGKTGLMVASVKGYIKTVKALLELGADPKIGKSMEQFIQIMRKGHYEIALLLLDKGMPIDFQDYIFWNTLEVLAEKVESEEIVKKPGISTKLFNKIFDRRPVVDLLFKKNIYIHKIVVELSNSSSITVLNNLVKASFINTPKLTTGSPGYKTSRHKIVSDPIIPIDPPKREYSKEANLHVVGVYEAYKENKVPWWENCISSASDGENTNDIVKCHQKYASKHEEGVIKISIHSKKSPIILALMSYEPVHWLISNNSGVKIEGVIISGYHSQRISGLSSEIALDVFTYRPSNCELCQVGEGSFYAYKRDSKEYTRMKSRLLEHTGRGPASFQGKYSAQSFVIIDR